MASPVSTPDPKPTPQPFVLSIPEEKLTALAARLAMAQFPDPAPEPAVGSGGEEDDGGWAYGTPLADVRRLVARWATIGRVTTATTAANAATGTPDTFNWRNIENTINAALPQYTLDVPVAGYGVFNIHFVHKRCDAPNAIPLLFVHGWPGSFLEVTKILPLLTGAPGDDDEPRFHVVAPSLPGYGFSTAPRVRGFAGRQFAEVLHNLMISLGYDEYVTQGGDWGYVITRKIAQLYGGRHCKATHTNMFNGRPPRLFENPILYLQHLLTPYTTEEKAMLARTTWFSTEGSGYMALQSTRPQTLGYALADSPVALLAWIYEKLVTWTDAYPWTDDEVLTWVTIYWFSRAGPAASLRIYYEIIKVGELSVGELELRTRIPVGISVFPKELIMVPKLWAKTVVSNLVFWKTHVSGGHFAAHEKPEELVDDLRRMFGRRGPAFGVVTRV